MPVWASHSAVMIAADSPLPSQLDSIEIQEITAALRTHHGNIAAAARALKIHRSTLQGKLRKHQLYPAKLGQ